MKAPAQTRSTCAHCGTPFQPLKEERYCCQGCAYVAGLLEEGGLERFYELKGTTVVPPVGARVFHEESWEWLETAVANAEAGVTRGYAEADFSIQGISCVGCVWLIEAVFRERKGAVDLAVDTPSARLRLSWAPNEFDVVAFGRKLAQLGYKLTPPEFSAEVAASHGLARRLGLCGFFLLNTMLFTLPGYLGMEKEFFLTPLFQILAAFFATFSLVTGGSYFFKRAWAALSHRRLHIDLPIAIGLLAAYAGSLIGWLAGQAGLLYFDFVATFTFLMLGGRWLQELALEQSRALLSKRESGPGKVTLVGGPNDGQSAAAEILCADMDYAVAPGAVVPVASRLQDAAGTVSLEWINGEAEPLTWPREKLLPAGAVNVGLGSLRLRAEESWEDSLLASLLQRPAETFHNKRLEQILASYLAVVLLLALGGGLAWTWALGLPWAGLQVAISVLVVSCPCALGVALPLADELSGAALRRSGLFIKSADVWERLRAVRWVVFDKTGTLTLETPCLLNPEVLDKLSAEAFNALHALVSGNLHPVARALQEALLVKVPGLARLTPVEAAALRESVGQGVCWADARGVRWSLGRPDWPEAGEEGPSEAQSVLRREDKVLAAFYLSEDVRDDALEACDWLRQSGLRLALLSGDARERVAWMAERLRIPLQDARWRCTPEGKAEWLQKNAPGQALMIGDGANDSLAFDAAVCRGTPVVERALLEGAADFFFFGRSLRGLPLLFKTARQRRSTVRNVFALAVSYNVGAVTLCLSGVMHPLLAAILMPISSLASLGLVYLGLMGGKNE